MKGNPFEKVIPTTRNLYTTLRVKIRYWHNSLRLLQAHIQESRRNIYVDDQAELEVIRSSGALNCPAILTERTEAFFLDGPYRWRHECTEINGDSFIVCIINDKEWWSCNQTGGVLSSLDSASYIYAEPPKLPDSLGLLDVSNALYIYTLESMGQTIYLGRQAIRFRAIPHENLELDFRDLWPGADEIDLLLDAEQCILLYAAGYIGGLPFATIEVLEIAFNQKLPEGALDIPPGNLRLEGDK